jgi:hypothetical protein
VLTIVAVHDVLSTSAVATMLSSPSRVRSRVHIGPTSAGRQPAAWAGAGGWASFLWVKVSSYGCSGVGLEGLPADFRGDG